MKNRIGLFLILGLIIGLLCSCNDSTSEASISKLESQTPINMDLEIVTREGHPTYYGSVEESHTIWSDVQKDKIHFADSDDKIGDATVISMSAYRKSDLIRGLAINFGKFEEPVSMTVDEILPIVASYMPFEIMDQYYQYKASKLLSPDEGKGDGYYYVISYNLTEEGKSAYYSKEHEYSGSIDIIILANKDGIVQSFEIGFGTPNWMGHLSTNNYLQNEWVCDLYDYR